MEERTLAVVVPFEEYNELVRKVERIAIVERMMAKCSYVSIDDVAAILDIGFPKE